jgi:hypothetical protein
MWGKLRGLEIFATAAYNAWRIVEEALEGLQILMHLICDIGIIAVIFRMGRLFSGRQRVESPEETANLTAYNLAIQGE